MHSFCCILVPSFAFYHMCFYLLLLFCTYSNLFLILFVCSTHRAVLSQGGVGVMEDFASSHMRKHGWSQGKGLGRKENGMCEPIKVKIKADTSGVGHDPGKQFTFHWWEHAFEKACNNIKVQETENGIQLSSSSDTTLSTSAVSKRLLDKSVLYGHFIKSGILENGIVRKDGSCTSSTDESDDEECDRPSNKNKMLTDEDLFSACGGRTAHKGARHGLRLSGKLARLAEQENIDQSGTGDVEKQKKRKMKPSDVTEEPVAKKTKKKRKKKKQLVEDGDNAVSPTSEALNSNELSESKKKRKKKKKKAKPVSVDEENVAPTIKRKKHKKLSKNSDDS